MKGPLVLIYNHRLIRLHISSKCNNFGFKGYRKINFLLFSPYKCIREQRNSHKVHQGQPRTNLVGPTSSMLHTKTQGHWLSDSIDF